MLFMQSNPVSRFFRHIQLRRIATKVRQGKLPAGVSKDEVFEALRVTRPKNAFEMFGLLSARHFDKHHNLIADRGLVAVKTVTIEFAKFLAQALMDSSLAAGVDEFNAHAMGDGSTAEASSDQALVAQKDGRNIGTQSLGATSNIYRSIATITATAAYSCCEHGLFDTTGAGDDNLLDRSIVTTFIVATDDEVEWTYELTINSETA